MSVLLSNYSNGCWAPLFRTLPETFCEHNRVVEFHVKIGASMGTLCKSVFQFRWGTCHFSWHTSPTISTQDSDMPLVSRIAYGNQKGNRGSTAGTAPPAATEGKTVCAEGLDDTLRSPVIEVPLYFSMVQVGIVLALALLL